MPQAVQHRRAATVEAPSAPRAPAFASERPDPSVMAHRLGIGLTALETYMRSHGGVPDGVAGPVPEAMPLPPPSGAESWQAQPDQSVLVLRALPAPSPRAPWVKRDRPRYFMAG
jgi:hypothetical protein